MNPFLEEKYHHLIRVISQYKRVLVAFSGGVDSTVLAKIAYDCLKENAWAITAVSSSYPESELETAKKVAESIGIQHRIITTEEMLNPAYQANPVDRCFHCKTELYQKLTMLGKEMQADAVLDGSNLDDCSDYRPGFRALSNLQVVSPLIQAKCTKQDVRDLAHALGLPNWEKPSLACLASRIPYGTMITEDILSKISRMEQLLQKKGFSQYRARYHSKILRIEIALEHFPMIVDPRVGSEIIQLGKELGFDYITLDLEGYRSGSMNKGIETA